MKNPIRVVLWVFLMFNLHVGLLFNSVNLTTVQTNGLQVIFPNGGETLIGEVTIIWSLSSEFYSDSTYYNLYYSPNNGEDWIQLAFRIKTTSYDWNTNLYETYGTNYFVKVTATSKDWETKEDISDNLFTIDNRGDRFPLENLFLVGFIVLIFPISTLSLGYYFYRVKMKPQMFIDFFHSDKIDHLKSIRHKLIIGLDNLQNGYNEALIGTPQVKEIYTPSSMVEYFPSDIQHELRSELKGRTVLVLIEIAYQDPSDTNPVKLAKNLNIPLSTLSKEIKKLRELQYIEMYVSSQVIQDARQKNFEITPKGFKFLSILNIVLKVTIDQLKIYDEC
ncbi:MAG: winged helix DNA-binding protein [Candidatus Hodarchaeota archaeon]